MAHELSFTINGKAEMMYVGEKPWHGLGTELPQLATAQEAIEAANLGWNVVQTAVYSPELPIMDSDGKLLRTLPGVEVPRKMINRRDDTGAPLGIVGDGYKILQNVDAFRFFDAFTQDPHGPKYETAGALYGGAKIWALCKLPETFEVVKGDLIEPYILLCNSHDGSMAIRVMETPIRVVCNNTLQMAVRGKNRKIHIRHSGDVFGKVKDVQETLGLVRQQFEETIEVYGLLAKKEPTKEEVTEVLSRLFPDTKTDRAKIQRERVQALAEGGTGNDQKGVRGTAWGLYNGITELEDHINGRGSDNQDARVNSIWFGSGAERKEKALATILEVCKIG